MTISDDKKAAIFRALAGKTLYDVGIEFGVDKHYKDAVAVRNKVYQIYNAVKNDPEKYSVHPETVELVTSVVSGRKVAPRNESTLSDKQSALQTKDIKELTLGGRDSAIRLIHSKLGWLETHPKALMEEKLSDLGKIFGILFDKSQIIQGQATEHVAVMGKIDTNMTPEQALDAIVRSREVIQQDKHG